MPIGILILMSLSFGDNADSEEDGERRMLKVGRLTDGIIGPFEVEPRSVSRNIPGYGFTGKTSTTLDSNPISANIPSSLSFLTNALFSCSCVS